MKIVDVFEKVGKGEDEGFMKRYRIVFRKTGSKFEDRRSCAYMEWSKNQVGFLLGQFLFQ
jgi:hypothetical protein